MEIGPWNAIAAVSGGGRNLWFYGRISAGKRKFGDGFPRRKWVSGGNGLFSKPVEFDGIWNLVCRIFPVYYTLILNQNRQTPYIRK